ncbi:Uncharacterized protein Fot_20601 [Forsythia ovata]|uniref:Uncharacterized protein n=1 Tax=Forsythia ovata TaxID=205694 RepID=A0ABD1USG2_9LAMI
MGKEDIEQNLSNINLFNIDQIDLTNGIVSKILSGEDSTILLFKQKQVSHRNKDILSFNCFRLSFTKFITDMPCRNLQREFCTPRKDIGKKYLLYYFFNKYGLSTGLTRKVTQHSFL